MEFVLGVAQRDCVAGRDILAMAAMVRWEVTIFTCASKTKRQSQKCGGDVPPPVTQANPLSPSVEVSELVDHVCYHSHTRTQPTRDA